MKPLAALLLAPALALAPGFGRVERNETRRAPLPAGSTLVVRTANGAIHVAAWDKEEVELQAEIKEREKDSVKLELRQHGSTLEIEAQLPSRGVTGWFGESDGASFTLKVPRRISGQFTTGNGRIEIAGLEGPQTLATSNGRISAEDIRGDVSAHTSNSSVAFKRIQGSLKGGTSNGGLELEQVSGGVEFSTSNGSIRAEGLDGQGKGITLTTSNGAIRLDLGKAAGEVDAATSNGSVNVKHQGMELLEMGSHRARVRMPGSAQTIRLRTSNGSITIQ